MTAIWVIERADAVPNVGRLLMGDFPVRAIASLPSLERILKLNKTSRPSLLVVDESLLDGHEGPDSLGMLCLEIPVIIIRCRDGAPLRQLPGARWLSLADPCDGLAIAGFVEQVMAQSADLLHALRLESLVLNLADLTLRSQTMDATIDLTPKEARLVKVFFAARSRPVSREELLRDVWGKTVVASRTIDSQVSRLRKRLNDFGVEIEGVYGGGYRMTVPPG